MVALSQGCESLSTKGNEETLWLWKFSLSWFWLWIICIYQISSKLTWQKIRWKSHKINKHKINKHTKKTQKKHKIICRFLKIYILQFLWVRGWVCLVFLLDVQQQVCQIIYYVLNKYVLTNMTSLVDNPNT